MNLQKIVLTATACALIGACASQDMARVPINASFTAEQLAYATLAGKVSISGQAFMRQRGGGIVTCAGSPVVLVPKIVYTATLMQRAVGGRVFDPLWVISHSDAAYARIPEMPVEIKSASKRALCEVAGKFSLVNVPPGEYYVTVQVAWLASSPQGGILVKPLTVADQNIEVQLSQ